MIISNQQCQIKSQQQQININKQQQMYRLIIKRWFSEINKKRDFTQKYSTYDDFIKQFNQKGNNINTSMMHQFLMDANPRISRQQNYLSKLTRIFKSCLPHFINNSQFYINNQLLSRILLLYQTLNIHRKQLFQIVENSTKKIQSTSLKSLVLYHASIVQLHHNSNPKFKTQLKQYIVNQLVHKKCLSKQKNSFPQKDFQQATQILKIFMMDSQFNFQQSQQILQFIQNDLFKTLKDVFLNNRNLGRNLSFIYELIQYRKLKISNQKFQKLLNSAKKYHLSQKNQSSEQVVKQENYKISFNNESIDKYEQFGSKQVQNSKVLHHGQSSVFETIFERCLQQIGYDYEKNKFIGIFEYDFIIKGKKSKPYCPFQHINQKKPFKAIQKQQFEIYKSMKDFSKIKIDERLDEQVVINLNGPYHYIDSNVYGNERVTRTDQIKGILVKNYGYKRYNSVYYAKWQFTSLKINKQNYPLKQNQSNLINYQQLKQGNLVFKINEGNKQINEENKQINYWQNIIQTI